LEYWPNAHVYGTGEELLEKEPVDIIDICTPSFLHSKYIIEALKKNKHVFCEKPVCLTENECQALSGTSLHSDKQVMVGHVVRFFPEYQYLKQAVDQNVYGKLLKLDLKRLSGDVPWGYEDWFHDALKSGSVMMDLHIHDLDFLHYLLGKPTIDTVKVERTLGNLINHVIATYKYDNLSVSAEGLWDTSPDFPFEASYTAVFDTGSLSFNSRKNPSLRFCDTTGKEIIPKLERVPSHIVKGTDINTQQLGPYYSETAYFLNCIGSSKKITNATLQDGIEAVRLVLQEETKIR
jgi:predicted dehydrogenase